MTMIKKRRIKIFIADAGIHENAFFEQVSLHFMANVLSTQYNL